MCYRDPQGSIESLLFRRVWAPVETDQSSAELPQIEAFRQTSETKCWPTIKRACWCSPWRRFRWARDRDTVANQPRTISSGQLWTAGTHIVTNLNCSVRSMFRLECPPIELWASRQVRGRRLCHCTDLRHGSLRSLRWAKPNEGRRQMEKPG